MKIIKVIDDEHIEISRYISPEARFFNPCIDIHNDYDKLESYCDFKETINPFQMYAENERLNNIINELEKWLEEQHQFIIEIPAYTKEIAVEHKTMEICYANVLDKLQELKGSDKE